MADRLKNLQINFGFINNLTIPNRISLKIVCSIFILYIFEHNKTTMKNNNNNNFNNPNL
jgi:hypothetical protein